MPFPFGLEDGCFAMENFRLFCTNATSSAFLHLGPPGDVIISLQVNEGILNYTEEIMNAPGFNLFYGYGLTSSSMQWVVANLSCAKAKQNASGYACVSINSRCVEVNTSDGYYFGYRCKCTDGFQGNPYIQSGCQGTRHLSPFITHFETLSALSHLRSGLQILMSAFSKTFVRAECAVI